MDRFGYRAALILALLLSMAGILLTLLQSVPAIVLGLTIFASGAFMAQAAGYSYLGIASQHGRSAAVGLYVTAYYVGGSLGGAVPGYFWNRAGWPACVACIVLVQIVTAVLVARYWKHRVPTLEHVTAAVE